MIAGATGALLMTQADSARAVAAVYTVSVLATLQLAVVAAVAFSLHSASAQARLLVWRSAVVVLLLAVVGRALPLHALAWAVPSALAAPLIALGRVQVTSASLSPRLLGGAQDTIGIASYAVMLIRALLVVYVAGVVGVLLPTVIAAARLRGVVRRARVVTGNGWALDEVRGLLEIRRDIRLYISAEVVVPMTWGAFRPVVVLPAAASEWTRSARRIVLLHELSHVRAADWMFNLAGRVICALYWFHPGAWWIVRGMRHDCELACDDRVIAAGIRRSDYAELLVRAADAMHRGGAPRGALALSQRTGLRARIAAVLDTRHDVRPLAGGWAAAAAMLTFAVAIPMSAIQLAPTRDALTMLMSDARWESRAYAVLGLAQRPDSVAVARTAAELDPSPRVRAWARYALGQSAASFDVRAVIHD